MNPELHLVSLILASTTGWVLLVLGALPVSVLRKHSREPLLAAGAWAVVAATAPPQVFHWYLIFAVLSLVAFTKLHRPMGKVWLAITAALGLSLGIVFPLEATPALLRHGNPYLLALLYLGGATTALAYAIGVTTARAPVDAWRPRPLARGFLLAAALWLPLLLARPYLAHHWAIVPPLDPTLSESVFQALNAALLGLAAAVLVLAVFILRCVNRPPLTVPLLAAPACFLAFAGSMLAQFLSR